VNDLVIVSRLLDVTERVFCLALKKKRKKKREKEKRREEKIREEDALKDQKLRELKIDHITLGVFTFLGLTKYWSDLSRQLPLIFMNVSIFISESYSLLRL